MSVDYLDYSVIVARPREPFVNWTRLLGSVGEVVGGPFIADGDEFEPLVLVVPLAETAEEMAQVLRAVAPEIFLEFVATWAEDEETWPDVDDRDLFAEWFSVEFLPVVGLSDLIADEVAG